jgi:tetratricopeptide (TPR) repeat protein
MKWFKWALIAAIITVAAMPAWSQRVLVFPFEQTAGPSSGDWIGTGLAVALDEGLTRGGVHHISYGALQRLYDQEGLVQSPGFALPAQIGLANQLGTGTLVRGSYQLDDNGLRVHLEAFDVKGNIERLGQWDESAKLSGLLELTDKLGQDLFGVLGMTWKAAAKVPPPAFESYIRGRITGDPTLQEVYYRKAVELDPDYNDAKCQLAVLLKSKGRISEAADILTEIRGKSFAKAYLALVTLGDIRMEQGRLEEAKQLMLRSLKEAENPEAHIGLAKLYHKQRKDEEALKELVVAERFGTHTEAIEALRDKIKADGAHPAEARGTEKTDKPEKKQ